MKDNPFSPDPVRESSPNRTANAIGCTTAGVAALALLVSMASDQLANATTFPWVLLLIGGICALGYGLAAGYTRDETRFDGRGCVAVGSFFLVIFVGVALFAAYTTPPSSPETLADAQATIAAEEMATATHAPCPPNTPPAGVSGLTEADYYVTIMPLDYRGVLAGDAAATTHIQNQVTMAITPCASRSSLGAEVVVGAQGIGHQTAQTLADKIIALLPGTSSVFGNYTTLLSQVRDDQSPDVLILDISFFPPGV